MTAALLETLMKATLQETIIIAALVVPDDSCSLLETITSSNKTTALMENLVTATLVETYESCTAGNPDNSLYLWEL